MRKREMLLEFVQRAMTCRSRQLFVARTRRAGTVALQNEDGATTNSNQTRIYSSLSSKRIDYVRGWAWQQVLLQDRLARRKQQETCDNDHDIVMVLEHEPVYTLGRGADENHLQFLCDKDEQTRHLLCRTNHDEKSSRLIMNRQRLQVVKQRLEENEEASSREQAVNDLVALACPVLAPNGVPIFRVERGGEVTFHGPGQLVVYPMLNLARRKEQDLHLYLRKMEQVVIDTLQHYGISSSRNDKNTGVWVGDDKIAAVGVSSSRWITTHGFAINVNVDLDYFDTSVILPCGVEDGGVTSLSNILSPSQQQGTPYVHDVAKVVLTQMENVFGMTFSPQQDWNKLT